MNNTTLEILKFSPILKNKIWGGSKLKDFLGKKSSDPDVGESWEISDVEGDISVVSKGLHQGKTLRELQIEYKDQLVGKKNYERFGDKFPLLIKFIDARDDLSVQLHPGDELAKKKHNSFGKTEMWYIMQSDPNANIIVGFNKEITPEEYKSHVAKGTIQQILNQETVEPGDTFFIYAGLVHAIGKGVMLAEIQQTSDITYRIYDWDRKDTNGEYRELHQDEAVEALDLDTTKEYKVHYKEESNNTTELVSCPYFITDLIVVEQKMTRSFKNIDSFVVLMCVEGEASIQYNGKDIQIGLGETVLVPAVIKEITIQSEHTKLLQVHV